MKISDRHKKILSEYWNTLSDKQSLGGGYYFLDEKYLPQDKNNPKIEELIILHDVYLTEFKSFYANIILSLYHIGYKIDKLSDDYEKLDYFIKNSETIKSENYDDYLILKKFSNSFFAKLQSPYFEWRNDGIKIAKMVIFYSNFILNELKKFNDNIIQIDTDQIHHIGELDFKDIYLDFQCCKIDSICFVNKKRYIYLMNNEYKRRAWWRNGAAAETLYEKIVNMIKSDRRRIKLDSLLTK
jgi:hypothetical protein